MRAVRSPLAAAFALWLGLFPIVRAAAGEPEKASSAASAPFDHSSAASDGGGSPPVKVEGQCIEAKRQLANAAAIGGTGGSSDKKAPVVFPKTKGLGPATWKPAPSYGEGLLGGFLGLLLAPFMFAYEAIVGLVATPYRMVKGIAQGDGWSWLEPLREAKNLLQDTVMTAIGMLNSATAPIWNAVVPESSTDFQFSKDRLQFIGGPAEKLVGAFHDCYGRWEAATTSWHTTFYTREVFVRHGDDASGNHSLAEHETVHNVQWKHSFLWEKQSHDFVGGDYSAAKENLNW
jgi:hypothetical protein